MDVAMRLKFGVKPLCYSHQVLHVLYKKSFCEETRKIKFHTKSLLLRKQKTYSYEPTIGMEQMRVKVTIELLVKYGTGPLRRCAKGKEYLPSA